MEGIRTTVKANVHDRTQVELDLDYSSSDAPDATDEENEYENCDVDLYLFVPSSIGINSNTYSREQFYNDLTHHIRLDAPDDKIGTFEFLEVLDEYFSQKTKVSKKSELVPFVCQQVKLFGNGINARLKRIHDAALILSKELDQVREDCINGIAALNRQLELFRSKYVEYVRQPRISVDSEVRTVLLNVDEFIINRSIATYSDLVRKFSKNWDYQFHGASDLIHNLQKVLIQESKYKRENERKNSNTQDVFDSKFTGISEEEIKSEYFYYRHGLLKKFVSRPLFIQKKTSKQEKIYRNWIAGSGAALAALWARVADFEASKMAQNKDIGLSFIGVAFIAISVYVFKDRIKDISKEYFNEKLKSYLPDYKVKLFHQFFLKNSQPCRIGIGQYQEYVRFLDAQSVPSEISFVRKLRGRRDIGEEHLENIIHYHKKLQLQLSNLKQIFSGTSALKDIIRFNFSYFLDHLDDHLKSLATYDENEGASEIRAPKVYHVNLVIRVSNGLNINIIHYRVILDKRGVLRLETINIPGVSHYEYEVS